MAICGLTLMPRKVRPRIFLVAISMNAMSLESRSTMMTTFVGSGTFTSADDPFGVAGITMPGMLGMGGGAAGAASVAEDAIRPLMPKRAMAADTALKFLMSCSVVLAIPRT